MIELFTARRILVWTLVAIWGMRLALHIGCRHTGEDYRYKEMRERWTNVDKKYYRKAYCYIFMGQALMHFIANLPSLYIMIFASAQGLIWLDYIGAIIWLMGFSFEVISDA